MNRTGRSFPIAGLALFVAGCLAAAEPAPSERPKPSDSTRQPSPGEVTVQHAVPPAPAVHPPLRVTLTPAAQTNTPSAQPQPAATPAPAAPGQTVCCPPPSSDVWTAKDYATIIGSLFAGTAGVLAFFVGLGAIWSNLRSTRNNNNQKTNEGELKSIDEKLDGFYGSYLQLSNTNKLIADELKQRHRDVPDMRILLLLLDPRWRDRLTNGDATLVDEIIDIDRSLLALIQENAGMVDAAVQPYLYRAAAHFRMMIRAHEGKLDNGPERYRAYVYPRQLDRVMQLEVDRLKARTRLLRSRPMKLHPPMAPLAIPAELALGEWPPADLLSTAPGAAPA
jgi:hypothetical protein